MSKKVALVLSSGGARGLAHIGVIEGLVADGYQITSIAGSSIGAVVGGVYAAGKLPELKQWLAELDKLEVFKLVDFTLSKQGFIRGERVFDEMKKFVEVRQIEELSIPFSAVAVDILNNKEVVFSSGDLFEAIRASAAIPSVLKPSIFEGGELVDGGVLNPIPINAVDRTNADLLVVSDVNASIPYHSPLPPPVVKKGKHQILFDQFIKKWDELMPTKTENVVSKKQEPKLSYFDLMTRSIDLMQDKISSNTIEKHTPDILINVSRDACSTFEFYRSKELIEAGKRAYMKAIDKIEL